MTIDVCEVKKRLKALLNNDDNLVNNYLRRYGPGVDIKNIKAVKEESSRSLQVAQEEEGEDPIYEITLTCPVCGRDDVPGYELRAKSQQVRQNLFLVPVYTGAMGFRTMDFTLLAVSVCPRCLFASPDKKDFVRMKPTGNEEIKSQLTANAIMTLQEKIGERKAILRSASDYAAYFSRPRTYDAAIDSYRLSMSRATVEQWYEQPYATYKSGAYALRIAKIMKDCGRDNREALREGLGLYEEAFRSSNCPAEEIEMQIIYTVVALYLKLGDLKKAHSYIAVFTNLVNQRKIEIKEDPSLNLVTIERWQEKANRLWEDRERDDLFTNE